MKTVNDLRNAQILLKSNDDIQIVVANELLETAEFKDFMSHLNLPQQTQHQLQDANHVPPNTPITTRPSSAVPMKINPDDQDSREILSSSPLPSTSRTMSHESSPRYGFTLNINNNNFGLKHFNKIFINFFFLFFSKKKSTDFYVFSSFSYFEQSS